MRLAKHPRRGYGIAAVFSGTKIRVRRESLGLTQTELAELIGAKQQEVSSYEKGKQPKLPRQRALAKALGVTRRDLFEDEDETLPTPEATSPAARAAKLIELMQTRDPKLAAKALRVLEAMLRED